MVKCCRAKINQTNLRRLHSAEISLPCSKAQTANLLRIVDDIRVGIHKQNVLGLQVCVSQVIVVKKLDSTAQLPANVTHLIQVIRLIAVVLQEVEDTEAKDVE